MVKPIQFPPSARRARGESVVEKLRREILLGRYQPGARLPPERELALKLGTNRNTLREAMRTLESEKLVRSRQGDGTLVLDWRAEGEINLLPHFLAEETPIDERFEALYTLFRLRDALIDQALSFAAGHTEDADVAALRGALAQLGAVESGTVAAVDGRHRVLSPAGRGGAGDRADVDLQHLRAHLRLPRRALSRAVEGRPRLRRRARRGRARGHQRRRRARALADARSARAAAAASCCRSWRRSRCSSSGACR